MANNKIVKWLVGLSGVALFTGFVGFSQQLDQGNAAAGKETSKQDRTGTSSLQNDIKQEWANANPRVTETQTQMNRQVPSTSNTDQSTVMNPTNPTISNQKHGGKMRSRATESRN